MADPIKTFRCSLEVRGYELDSFGHVNHAVYVSYLEHARWKMLEASEITLAKLTEWKRWPVIASIEVNYLRPTFIGESLEVLTEVAEHAKTFLIFEHTIIRGDVRVVKARVKCVIVNENGRPVEMPSELSRLWGSG